MASSVRERPTSYPQPLAGEKTVPALVTYIAKNMPADDPGACEGADAAKVAAYIHDAFYSKEARARNRPPRIEILRLTVRQYRNAVADLIGSFRTPGKTDIEPRPARRVFQIETVSRRRSCHRPARPSGAVRLR